MMKNKIFNIIAIIVMLFCNLSLFAQNAMEDTTMQSSGTMTNAADSVSGDSVSQIIHANTEAIANINHIIGFYGLILMVIGALLIICLILVGLLTYSKIHKNKKSHRYSGSSELDEMNGKIELYQQKTESTIEDINRTLTSINGQLSELQLKVKQGITEQSEKKQAEKQKSSSVQSYIQYLKAEKNDGFFFEGDSKNDIGCQFMVTYKSKHEGSQGRLELITDLNNIKAIPGEFFRSAFKTIGKATLKDATHMKMTNSGICEYKQEDGFGIWKIIRPIEIKLSK